MVELSQELIESICECVKEAVAKRNKLLAIRTIREPFGFGLIEAKNYVDCNWGSLETVVRKDLEEKAGIEPAKTKPNPVRIFENDYFRLEVKKPEIPFDVMNEFFGMVSQSLLSGHEVIS